MLQWQSHMEAFHITHHFILFLWPHWLVQNQELNDKRVERGATLKKGWKTSFQPKNPQDIRDTGDHHSRASSQPSLILEHCTPNNQRQECLPVGRHCRLEFYCFKWTILWTQLFPLRLVLVLGIDSYPKPQDQCFIGRKLTDSFHFNTQKEINSRSKVKPVDLM